jgi:8-oxo-dGTP diphosphatase
MFVNARAIIERKIDLETEILLQVRDKPNEPKGYELPGGRLEEFESIESALYREVFEETGLKVKGICDPLNHRVYSNNEISIEGLTPLFVYQTLKGPVDSIGFIFRCKVEEGELTKNDESYGHRWMSIEAVEDLFRNTPTKFDFLTQGLLDYYFEWVRLKKN